MKVRLYAHCGVASGYGRAANELAYSLLSAGVDLEIRALAATKDRSDLDFSNDAALVPHLRLDGDLSPNPDVIIVHTLPLDCARVLAISGIAELNADASGKVTRAPQYEKTLLVAYTTWEGAGLAPPDMLRRLAAFDHVWSPSSTSARALGGHVMPHSYDADAPAMPQRLSRGRSYTFLYVGAWNSRKNPAGVLLAYASAFTRRDEAVLELHCAGAKRDEYVIASHVTGLDRDEMPFVNFVNDRWTDGELRHRYSSAMTDCFVTASRGEAWNLPAFESMIGGRHIITPQGMGSDDFLQETSATLLVKGTLQPARLDVIMEPMPPGSPENTVRLRFQGAQGITCKHDWLEPDISELASAMRLAYETRTRDSEVNYDIPATFGRQAVGQRARALLEKHLHAR